MEQPKVVMNDRNTVLPPPVIECSSPPCYAHEVDPVYMGLVQTEPQGHDVSVIEKVGAGRTETREELPEAFSCVRRPGMNELLQSGKQVLASQPFSALVGAELTGFSPGQVELTLSITPQLKQQHGFVHGGVIGYVADNALTFAGGSVLGPAVVTSEYKINYLRPARGTVLIARATVIYSSKTQAVCRCDVFVIDEGKENLCAIAQGTLARIGQSSEAPA